MPSQTHVLTLLPGEYAIYRLPATAHLPAWVEPVAGGDDNFVSVTRTRDELSIVCPSRRVPQDVPGRSDGGWRCLRVEGPLDFALTGVLASLAKPLAEAKVSLLAIATFDTDYLLVRDVQLDLAIDALQRAGNRVQ